MPHIDLNADLGEHDGNGYPGDQALLDIVSSASIACGEHAGSRAVMIETARRAAATGVAIGAHPSYPDREEFGRRELGLSAEEITRSVLQQLGLMTECCRTAGAELRYVKLHGALYNRAMSDSELADSIADAISRQHHDLAVLSLPGSALGESARRRGLKSAREAFIDRAYTSDGALVPRTVDGAVIHDIDAAVTRVLQIVTEQSVTSIDGAEVPVEADSLCVHSDSRNAFAMMSAVRAALLANGFSVQAFA
jgi:UPF0271 protein